MIGSPGDRAFVTMVISVMASVIAAFTPVPQAAADDGYFYIVNSSTQMMVEVLGHSTDDGSPVVLWPYYGGTSQQFTVERLPLSVWRPPEELWFLLRARHSGKCLKTRGYQSGAPVVQAQCDGDASQMWRVRRVVRTSAECTDPHQCFGGERHVLENYYDSGRRCLDAANGNFPAPPVQGAGLQAWDCILRFSAPNVVNQEWELVYIGDWGNPGPVVH
jgi:hypothetical protein